MKGRESDMLRMRLAFTERFDEMHVKTLARHSLIKAREDQNEAHEQVRVAQAASERRQKKEGPFMLCLCCGP